MKPPRANTWSAVIAFTLALAFAIAAARCSVDVPLGVDPHSDAAHVDAGDAGQ
jgi:hypothetical protein